MYLSRMRLVFTVAIVLSTEGIATEALAQNYPEFNGNYAKCSSGWCEVTQQGMNVVSMWQDLSPYTGKSGKNLVVYNGFFKIPSSVFKSSTAVPRFVLYTGKATVDPERVAIVEFGKMPFNGQPIQAADGKVYGQKVAYVEGTFQNPIWTIKREVAARYKMAEGKVGMVVVEPREPLSDGFYGIDEGTAGQEGHSRLASIPSVMDFHKEGKIQTVIPFVVGNVAVVGAQGFMPRPPDIEFSGRRMRLRAGGAGGVGGVEGGSSGVSPAAEQKIDAAIGSFVDGLFGRKKVSDGAASEPSN